MADTSVSGPRSAESRRPRLSVRSFGLTDRGRTRANNEDHFLIAELTKAMRIEQTSLPEPSARVGEERGYLFLVADGMGGHQAGERASAIAVAVIEQFTLNTFKWFLHPKGPETQRLVSEFQTAVQHADATILKEAARHPELRGMGTTLTVAYCLDAELFVAHVGDSRAYVFRNGTLEQLTEDHTVIAEMVRRGVVEPEQAASHHLRHAITNVIGGSEAGVHVEVHKVALQAGDQLLLSSDGLTEMIPNAEIAAILAREPSPHAACVRLVAEANARGGTDNITAVVAHFSAE